MNQRDSTELPWSSSKLLLVGAPPKINGPPFFAALRGSERPGPRSLRLPFPVRGDRREKVRCLPLLCFLRGDAAWWRLGLGRSTAFGLAARRGLSGQVLLF